MYQPEAYGIALLLWRADGCFLSLVAKAISGGHSLGPIPLHFFLPGVLPCVRHQ